MTEEIWKDVPNYEKVVEELIKAKEDNGKLPYSSSVITDNSEVNKNLLTQNTQLRKQLEELEKLYEKYNSNLISQNDFMVGFRRCFD